MNQKYLQGISSNMEGLDDAAFFQKLSDRPDGAD